MWRPLRPVSKGGKVTSDPEDRDELVSDQPENEVGADEPTVVAGDQAAEAGESPATAQGAAPSKAGAAPPKAGAEQRGRVLRTSRSGTS